MLLIYIFRAHFQCLRAGGPIHYRLFSLSGRVKTTNGVTSIIKVYTYVWLEWVYFSDLQVYELVPFSTKKYINGVSFSLKKFMNM